MIYIEICVIEIYMIWFKNDVNVFIYFFNFKKNCFEDFKYILYI